MTRPALYLLYAFAGATVLAMSATTIVLGLLIIVLAGGLIRKNVSTADFKKDSLLYAAVYAWKAFTRALATSAGEILKIKGVWDRLPYVVIGFYKIHREAVLTIFQILFAANAVIVVYALGQHFLGIPPIYKPLFFMDSGRISGYFGHPNQYAGCISLILIMNLCLALYQDKKFYLYTPFLLTGLVFAGARSYFLGVFICCGILVLLSRSWKTVLRYAAAAAVVLSVLLAAVPWEQQRMADSFSLEKNTYRLNFWKISWDLFLENPAAGIGGGLLPRYLEPYKKQGLIDNTAHAHNLYLHELAEGGIPGFLLVTGVHLYFLVKYLKVFRRSTDPLLRAFSLGVALSFVNLLVAGVFEYNFGAAIVALNLNFLMGVLEGYRSTDPGMEPQPS
jgi:O-antigen ligase